jgi:rod shape determining protein RodA
MFFIHLFINVGMALGLIPVAGIPLPFISYGGSSYLGFIVAAAIILNINIRRFVH